MNRSWIEKYPNQILGCLFIVFIKCYSGGYTLTERGDSIVFLISFYLERRFLRCKLYLY